MEVVRWKDKERYPNMPPIWFPIDKAKGIITVGHLVCNDLPKNCEVIGEVRFSAEPIFSKPIVTFYCENA